MLWILDSFAIYILHTSAQYQVLVQIGPCFLKWSKIAKTNISIKRPNIACNDEMRYKKDTKAKHVVSYIATRNLVKFLALNNLPVQCQRLLKLLLLLLLLVLPCSAAETTTLWLWTFLSLTNSWENWIFQNGNFYSWNIFFFILLQSGTFLASCWPVVLCRCVLLKWRQTMNHIYIILLPVSTLWYIICSLFNHALVVLLSLQPLTIQISHHQWRIVILFLSDCWLPLKQVFPPLPNPKNA